MPHIEWRPQPGYDPARVQDGIARMADGSIVNMHVRPSSRGRGLALMTDERATVFQPTMRKCKSTAEDIIASIERAHIREAMMETCAELIPA